MSGLQILVLMAMPAAVLVVGMIKLERVWLPVLRKLPLWQRVGAAVWFSLVPESEPKLLFNFASAPAKGVWGRSAPFASSFPDTFPVLGRDCYMYYFDVPQELLDEEGALESALQVEREIALGNATAGFNLLGALALQHEGRLFLAVTGFVTNSVTGEVLYFDSGRLADPPERTTSGEEVL